MKNKKIEIILGLEFLSGPILPSDLDTGESFTESDVINKDPILCHLNVEIGNLFSSYFEFDSHDVACWFDEETFNKDKPRIKSLVEKLKARLEELNDGSFVVIDNTTEDLK